MRVGLYYSCHLPEITPDTSKKSGPVPVPVPAPAPAPAAVAPAAASASAPALPPAAGSAAAAGYSSAVTGLAQQQSGRVHSIHIRCACVRMRETVKP